MARDNDYTILSSCREKIREMLDKKTGINKIFDALKELGFSGNRQKLVAWMEETGLRTKRQRIVKPKGPSAEDVLATLAENFLAPGEKFRKKRPVLRHGKKRKRPILIFRNRTPACKRPKCKDGKKIRISLEIEGLEKILFEGSALPKK